MFPHLPELLSFALLQLLFFLAWLAWRSSPGRQGQIGPYRQARKALVVLEPAAQQGAVQAHLAAHVAAARDAGLEVVGVESAVMRGPSAGWSGRLRAMDFSEQAALPMFCATEKDAFESEEFEAFLLALKVDELYLAGGGPEFDIHRTARSAMVRGYKVSVLINAIDVYGGPAAIVPVEQALHYVAGQAA